MQIVEAFYAAAQKDVLRIAWARHVKLRTSVKAGNVAVASVLFLVKWTIHALKTLTVNQVCFVRRRKSAKWRQKNTKDAIQIRNV
jgi:hypothetical protein